MPYRIDRDLGELFSFYHFLDTLHQVTDPSRSEILREAEEARIKRTLTDAEWARREPEVRAEWTRQAEEYVAKVRGLLRAFFDALPGPRGEDELTWDTAHQQILQDWLRPVKSDDEPPGVPHLCIFALKTFTIVKRLLLAQVPSPQRKEYAGDLQALTARWIVDDGQRAYQDQRIRDVILKFHEAGASARFILMLSFVPTPVFDERLVLARRMLMADRRAFDLVIKRFSNPATTLSTALDDPLAGRLLRDLIQWRAKGMPPLKNATDEDIKQIICRAFRRLPRWREGDIWSAIGLDKRPPTERSRQWIWDSVALPLLDYLKPFAPRRKDEPIPESLFSLTSRLLHLRSGGLWEDVPGRLKSRWYYDWTP